MGSGGLQNGRGGESEIYPYKSVGGVGKRFSHAEGGGEGAHRVLE